MQQILLKPPENTSMVEFFIFINNAIRKKNQILRDQHKYEFSLFPAQILASAGNNLNYSYNLDLMSTFFDSHEKRKQVHGRFNALAIFCIIIIILLLLMVYWNDALAAKSWIKTSFTYQKSTQSISELLQEKKKII